MSEVQAKKPINNLISKDFTNKSNKKTATGLKVRCKQACVPKRGDNKLFGNFDKTKKKKSTSHDFSVGTVEPGETITINFETTANSLTLKKTTRFTYG